MNIDFTTLPKDGRRFEAMVCELLRSMSFPIVEEPAVGADGGRDILIERVIRDALSERRERVVVQCKHFAHGGKAVSEKDLGIWINALLRYGAQGYLLVTSTTVTEQLSRAFTSFTDRHTPQFAAFWSGEKLETLLNEHVLVRDTFFPPTTPRTTRDLGQYGWGIVFPSDVDPSPVMSALAPLLALRRHQVESAGGSGVYREFLGDHGVHLGETSLHWLARHGVGPGTPNPYRVPFFLLLIGNPDVIDFEFQAHLQVQYFAARLAFTNVSDYARYAQAVCEVEAPGFLTARKVTFLAPERDIATRMTSEQLVAELAEGLAERRPEWQIKSVKAEEATKERFREIFGVREDSTVIFAATHGFTLPAGHAQQLLRQGALFTNDWPGLDARVTPEHYFAANDLSVAADLRGKCVIFFGCYGAGTLLEDEYDRVLMGASTRLADKAFVAALPQKLLAAGLLALIGHVGRAWTSSPWWK